MTQNLKKTIIVLALMIFSSSNSYSSEDAESWVFKDWEVMPSSTGYLRAITHGGVVWGNQFGLIKSTKNCNQDLLWLTISTYEDDLEALREQQIDFKVRIDKEEFQLGLSVSFLNKVSPLIKVVTFTNFEMGALFIEGLKKGSVISFEIIGPNDLKNKFDLTNEHFSLNGFIANYGKLNATCKDPLALNVPPSKDR